MEGATGGVQDAGQLRDTHVVSLTPKALDVLMVLIARAGHLVSKDDLLDDVWPDTFVEEANLSYGVSLSRKALEDTVALSSANIPKPPCSQLWDGITQANHSPRESTGDRCIRT